MPLELSSKVMTGWRTVNEEAQIVTVIDRQTDIAEPTIEIEGGGLGGRRNWCCERCEDHKRQCVLSFSSAKLSG